MLTVALIIEGLFGLPFRGDPLMMIAAGSLLIIAYLAVGALMQLLALNLATGLGITGLIVSPAFGYAGVGFPTLGMNAFAHAWSAILPLRWYMAVLFGQAARGLPLQDSAESFAVLAALAAAYVLLCTASIARDQQNHHRHRFRNRNRRRLLRRPASLELSRPSGSVCSQFVAHSFFWYWRR